MKSCSTLKRLVMLIALVCAPVFATLGQPAYVNYQGRLNDAAGQPLATGTYTLEFNIYNDPVGADSTNRVWGPFLFDGAVGAGHGAVVNVIGGRFNVILGPADTVTRSIRDAFEAENRYLEIKVNNGAPILPRQQFLSTPYAFKARGVTGDLPVPGNLAVQGNLSVGGVVQGALNVLGEAKSTVNSVDYFMVPRGSIVMWSGSPTNIPSGWALCDGSNGTPDLSDRFVMGFNPAVPTNVIGQTGGTTNHTHVVDIGNLTTTTANGTAGVVAPFNGNETWFNEAHNHTVNPPATTSTATPHIPPYVRLGFIMKL
ncbi:MAG TPA: hypothetical protein VJW76_04190 [Verrucomicrobiae bacterium]|nr:hypothetical protein [Verrucomicrobiae bacterium]